MSVSDWQVLNKWQEQVQSDDYTFLIAEIRQREAAAV